MRSIIRITWYNNLVNIHLEIIGDLLSNGLISNCLIIFISNCLCHDPSHGGFYMAEGTLYIRIRLSPHVVLGDRLAPVSLWTDRSLSSLSPRISDVSWLGLY